MRQFKGCLIAIAAFLTVIFLICCVIGIAYYRFKPFYYRFLYPWDRITGTITVSTDGAPGSLQPNAVSADEDTGLFSIPRSRLYGNGTARVMIHGGKYGGYGFLLTVDGVEHPMHISAYQYNWWNVTEFDLQVSVDTAENTVTLASTAKTLNEDGSWRTVEYSETYSLSDPDIRFAVVWI